LWGIKPRSRRFKHDNDSRIKEFIIPQPTDEFPYGFTIASKVTFHALHKGKFDLMIMKRKEGGGALEYELHDRHEIDVTKKGKDSRHLPFFHLNKGDVLAVYAPSNMFSYYGKCNVKDPKSRSLYLPKVPTQFETKEVYKFSFLTTKYSCRKYPIQIIAPVTHIT